jgi:tripartite-type tricarboxylate transporter receptor subunit TctC
MFCDATVALPNIQAGKVTALGTSAARPTELVPNVQPVAATVPGFDWQAWQGIVAPAGTPKDVVARLSSELEKLKQNPDFRAQLARFGMEPSPPQTSEEFAALVRAEQPRWIKAVRESGAKVD